MPSTILTTALLGSLSSIASGMALEPRLNNGLGRTPAMGWNSWNAFGCNGATASAANTAASQLSNLGLASLGYKYVNMDDCWSSSNRDGSGNLVADPSKWPSGMKAAADQMHSKGFKFGLYGDAGKQTCAGHPGSLGHEQQDAKLLASWGIDYWKYDNCYTNCNGQYPQTCWIARDTQGWYTTFQKALASAGASNKILYSLCSWGLDNVWTWGNSVGNSWRMHPDIGNNWASVAGIAHQAAGIARYSQPGGFNDLDMLEISNGGLSQPEERAHFGLWCITKSPLIIGTDLAKIYGPSLTILKNKLLISINQDSLGIAASYFTPSGQAGPGGSLYPYWAGKLSDGVVVGIVAPNGAATFTVNFKDVPGLGAGTFKWTEAYTGKTGSGSSVTVSLASHDMAVYKVTK